MDTAVGFLVLIIGGGFLLFLLFSSNSQFYCKQCHTTGESKHKYAFNGFVELIVWAVFIPIAITMSWLAIIPAILISIWRISSKQIICGACNSLDIIPTDSPAALQLAEDNQITTCPFCAETIKKSAIVCKHCAKDLPVLS